MIQMKASKRRAVFIVSTVIIVAFLVSVGVFSARRIQSNAVSNIQEPKHWLRSVPAVSSNVKDLEIINPRIVRQDTDAPGVAFEILNKSSRAVMSVEIACGKASIAKDGLEDEDNPTVVIEPYGTLTAEMTAELSPDTPIVITAAIFENGKKEGDKFTLDRMQKIRTRQRALLKARKAQAEPGRNPNQ